MYLRQYLSCSYTYIEYFQYLCSYMERYLIFMLLYGAERALHIALPIKLNKITQSNFFPPICITFELFLQELCIRFATLPSYYSREWPRLAAIYPSKLYTIVTHVTTFFYVYCMFATFCNFIVEYHYASSCNIITAFLA